MSPFIPVFLGSCNSSHMQGMLQVLVFFRTDSAPWQDLAPGRHGKKTPVQLELLCVPAFLQRGENLSLLRAFMEKKIIIIIFPSHRRMCFWLKPMWLFLNE